MAIQLLEKQLDQRLTLRYLWKWRSAITIVKYAYTTLKLAQQEYTTTFQPKPIDVHRTEWILRSDDHTVNWDFEVDTLLNYSETKHMLTSTMSFVLRIKTHAKHNCRDPLALKVPLHYDERPTASRDLIAKFKREIDMVMKLQNRHILALSHYFASDIEPLREAVLKLPLAGIDQLVWLQQGELGARGSCIVYELMHGTLADWMDSKKRANDALTENDCWFVGLQLLHAVAYLGTKYTIHQAPWCDFCFARTGGLASFGFVWLPLCIFPQGLGKHLNPKIFCGFPIKIEGRMLGESACSAYDEIV